MDFKQQIEAFERQIKQRMDHLASNDPMCQRLMGRIEMLREMDQEPVEVEVDG